MAYKHVTTGSIGESIIVSGENLSSVNKVFYSQQPAYAEGARFFGIDFEFLESIVPDSVQWGPITIVADIIAKSGTSDFDFVPNPEIISLDDYSPSASVTIGVSGRALSGVTGAYFGIEEDGTHRDSNLTGIVLSGSVTSIGELPIIVPTGNISGMFKIVGQSGLYDVSDKLSVSAKITGINPTSGYEADQVVLSGVNFIPEALYLSGADYYEVSFGNGVRGSFKIDSTNVLTGHVPYHADSGMVNLVNSNNGLHTGGIDFNVLISPPTVISSEPESGVPAGYSLTDAFSIFGSNFVDITGVYSYPSYETSFDINTANNLIDPFQLNFNLQNRNQLQISAPSGTGYQNLVIQTEHGTGQGEEVFFLKYAPVVSGFGPRSLVAGDDIYITGSGFFTDHLLVYFSGLGPEEQFKTKIFVDIQSVIGDARDTSPPNTQQVMTVTNPGLSSSTSYKLIVENGVGIGVSSLSASFLGHPKIDTITPTSGRHGDTITLSGESLGGNVDNLKHGFGIDIPYFSPIAGESATGMTFTVPDKQTYLSNDLFYGKRYNRIIVGSSAGSSTSEEYFLTIPDDIVCSGFIPEVVFPADEIIISGGNLELVKNVIFSGGLKDGVRQRSIVRVKNDGMVTEFHPLGSDSPKTGISIRVPGDVSDGKIILSGIYSSCQTTQELIIDKDPADITIISGSGVFGDKIRVSGENLHGQALWFRGYRTGTIDISNPVDDPFGEFIELNKGPLEEFIPPLSTEYVTDPHGFEVVDITIPATVPEFSELYVSRIGISSPSRRDFKALRTGVFVFPIVSGISHTEIHVGDTLYVTGVNAMGTLENAVGISGTGIPNLFSDISTDAKEIEFVSKYNTKITQLPEQDGVPSWMDLGGWHIPNWPKELFDSGDPLAHKFNANIRKHVHGSGVVDTTPPTGTYVIPIEVGDNFVGTGFIFLFFDEHKVHKQDEGATATSTDVGYKTLHWGHNKIVERGPDSVSFKGKTYQGRRFDDFDFDGDGKNDTFLWSGYTHETNYENRGEEYSPFWTGFSGSYNDERFGDILYTKHPLVILPEIIEITGISPSGGFPGESLSIFGSGFKNATEVFITLDDVGEDHDLQVKKELTVINKEYEYISTKIPSVDWQTNQERKSGYITVKTRYSTANSSGLESGHVTIERPPDFTGFYPDYGIEGETVFYIGGTNLKYINSLWLRSNTDYETVDVTYWGFENRENDTIGISGLTPQGMLPLPDDFTIFGSATDSASTTSVGPYTVVVGDLTVHGSLYVAESAYIQEDLVVSGNTFAYQDLDVSGEYLLDGIPFDAGSLIKRLPRENKILHLSAENKFSYIGTGATWNDISKSKNDATLINSPTFGVNELEFNGVDQYVTLPMIEPLKVQDFTIGIFFKPNEVGGTIATPIIAAPNLIPTELVSYDISYDSNRRFFSNITFTDETSSTVFTDQVDTGSYHVVHATWDGTIHKIFISGEEANSNTPAAGKIISYTDTSLNILTNRTASQFVEGDLRDIHMYSGALSGNEIYDIYSNLNNVFIYDRDLVISGGKIKIYEQDNPSNFGIYEDNFISLSGENAGISINGHLLDPQSERYKWENVTIGDKIDFVSSQGTGTSTSITGTTDHTLVGSVLLEMQDAGQWRNVKVVFGTLLFPGLNSIKDFEVRIGSDVMDWPYKFSGIDTTISTDSTDVTFIAEGLPVGYIAESPLLLDVYARPTTFEWLGDLTQYRTIYGAGVYGTGSGVGVWNITTEGNVELAFQPNTGEGSIIGTAIYTGDGISDSFQLEYTEGDTERIFVSLDGIELVPEIDFTIVDLTGVKINSAPSAGEEVFLRQISNSIVVQPTTNIVNFGDISGLTLSDLSTGTQMHFSGEISSLDVENYNIYDSNVSITGGGQTIHNEFSGITVNIDNNATATAVNVFTEPGGDSTMTSTNANVVVANEGVTSYITNLNTAYIFAETGAGKVFITGGQNLLTGNVYITGGENIVSGGLSTVSINDGENTIFFTDEYSEEATVTGVNITIFSSGTIENISGETLTIQDSQLSNFGYSGTQITIQGDSVTSMTGEASGLTITQNAGTANYHFSGAAGGNTYLNTITANSAFSAIGYDSTTFNVTGNDATINSSVCNIDTENITTYESTNSITGTTIDDIFISGIGNVTYIDVQDGNLSFTGASDSTNIISGANTVNATGVSYIIYNSTVTIGGE
jgi:hypothetical protein